MSYPPSSPLPHEPYPATDAFSQPVQLGYHAAPLPPQPYYGHLPPPLPGPPPELLAGLGQRFLAKLVDVLVGAAIVAVFLTLMITFQGKHTSAGVTALLISGYVGSLIFALVFYDPLFTAKGGTIGKRVCDLRVVYLESGRPISMGTAFGRHLMGLIIGGATCVPIGYLWCTWDKPYRQGLHDKIVRTVVVRSEP